MINEMIEKIGGRAALEEMIAVSHKLDSFPSGLSVGKVKAMARALLAVLDAKPIGWFTDDHKDDKSATTYSKDVADMWLGKGWPVSEIYATPPVASEPVSNGYTLPEWVPVSERMPDNGLTVLVCQEGGITFCAEVEGREFYPDEFPHVPKQGREITHWMDMPEPPAAPAPGGSE